MRFLVDADLPTALANRLQELQHDCIHISTIGRGTDPDELVFQRAQLEQRVLITRDGGFANIVRFPLESHCGIIRIRAKGFRRAQLIELVTSFLARHPAQDLMHMLVILTPDDERFRRP